MTDIRVDEDSMRLVIEELRRRGEDLSQMKALDMFGGDGLRETVYWGNNVKDLEIWEFMPHYKEGLRKLFPKAMIKIVDSYQEVLTRKDKFDLIVVDNPTCKCVGGHHEHFDIFPYIFNLCREGTILILDVIPVMIKAFDKKQTYYHGFRGWLERSEHLSIRGRFYKSFTPDNMTRDWVTWIYEKRCEEVGFTVTWSFIQPRSGSDVEWLVLNLASA